jgi:hypothetical protein
MLAYIQRMDKRMETLDNIEI